MQNCFVTHSSKPVHVHAYIYVLLHVNLSPAGITTTQHAISTLHVYPAAPCALHVGLYMFTHACIMANHSIRQILAYVLRTLGTLVTVKYRTP